MTIGEIIKKQRKEMGLTLEEVGRQVGVSKSTVAKWETGYISNMRRDRIALLASTLNISPSELLTNPRNDRMPANCVPVDIIAENVQVAVIGRVAAGLACHAEDDVEGYEFASRSIVSSSDNFVYLRVQGDSMSPLIMEGDLVLIRCQSSIDSGTLGVVVIDDEDGVIKRVRYGKDWIELISENPYYPPRRFEGEDITRVRVFGRVMECKRKF